MHWYSHILNSPRFEQGATGTKIFRKSIRVSGLIEGENRLEERSTVENNFIVGIWLVDKGEEDSQKAYQAFTIPDQSVIDVSYLTFRVDTTDVLERVPLREIQKANSNGHPYYLQIGEKINLSESNLYIADDTNLVSTDIIEFGFDYVRKAKAA